MMSLELLSNPFSDSCSGFSTLRRSNCATHIKIDEKIVLRKSIKLQYFRRLYLEYMNSIDKRIDFSKNLLKPVKLKGNKTKSIKIENSFLCNGRRNGRSPKKIPT